MSDSEDAVTDPDWSLYPYDPNVSAPIAFTVILAIVAIYQLYQCFSKSSILLPAPNHNDTNHHSHQSNTTGASLG